MHAGRIPKGRLLFNTQISENLTANFLVFSRKKVGSTVEPQAIRPMEGGYVVGSYHRPKQA